MKTEKDIKWEDGVLFQGNEPQKIPNVEIGERLSFDGDEGNVSSIWFFGAITVRRDNNTFFTIEPKYISEIIYNKIKNGEL